MHEFTIFISIFSYVIFNFAIFELFIKTLLCLLIGSCADSLNIQMSLFFFVFVFHPYLVFFLYEVFQTRGESWKLIYSRRDLQGSGLSLLMLKCQFLFKIRGGGEYMENIESCPGLRDIGNTQAGSENSYYIVLTRACVKSQHRRGINKILEKSICCQVHGLYIYLIYLFHLVP